MAVVEVELIPELFSRVPMHPAEAALDRVGRAAVAGQGIGGFLGWHRCKRNDAAGRLIYTHEASPNRKQAANYTPVRRAPPGGGGGLFVICREIHAQRA